MAENRKPITKIRVTANLREQSKTSLIKAYVERKKSDNFGKSSEGNIEKSRKGKTGNIPGPCGNKHDGPCGYPSHEEH